MNINAIIIDKNMDLWYKWTMQNKQMKIRLHPVRHKKLKILAAASGKSVNFIVEVAISKFLADHHASNHKAIENTTDHEEPEENEYE